MTRTRKEPYPDDIITKQYTSIKLRLETRPNLSSAPCIVSTGLHYGTRYFDFTKSFESWEILEKHTYIHTYILTFLHTYIQTSIPEPVFHRLLDSGFAPSALSPRLNKYHRRMYWKWYIILCFEMAEDGKIQAELLPHWIPQGGASPWLLYSGTDIFVIQ